MEVRFVIPGPPKGKGRPRFSQVAGHAKATTPKDTVLYENLVRTEYQRQCGEARFEDGSMLDLRVVAYYPIPSSKSKKQQRLMEDGVIRPTRTTLRWWTLRSGSSTPEGPGSRWSSGRRRHPNHREAVRPNEQAEVQKRPPGQKPG